MHIEKFAEGEDDPDAAARMADFFGPAQVDQTVRQALQICWMALPKGSQDGGGFGAAIPPHRR